MRKVFLGYLSVMSASIKPDSFIIFEGFDNRDQLAELADNVNCCTFTWESRNHATAVIQSGNDAEKLNELFGHLRYISDGCTPSRRKLLLHPGPEHDAYDFRDPWARMRNHEKMYLYFLYQMLPGNLLSFNGQIYGRRHAYSNDPRDTNLAPLWFETEQNNAAAWMQLFGLRKCYPNLSNGEFRFLGHHDKQVISTARFDDRTFTIGVINSNQDKRDVSLFVKPIIDQQAHFGISDLWVYRGNMRTLNVLKSTWEDMPVSFSAEELTAEG